MKKNLNIQFEKAIRLLSHYLPISTTETRKPILFHDIRVGVYLYEQGYSEQVVLAGVLHDALEFSEISEEKLRAEFGDAITKLVRANSKDDSITDPKQKTEELIQRCVASGQDALIVKAADIIDSFKFYSAEQNEDQLKYCARNAEAILKYKPMGFNDKIFDELKVWKEKFNH